MTIKELGVSLRSFNCLTQNSVNTLYELLTKTRAELLLIKNLTEKCIDNDIAVKVGGLGYTEWVDAILNNDPVAPAYTLCDDDDNPSLADEFYS
jgi:hypothetical protein